MEEIFTNINYQEPIINKDGLYEIIVTYQYKNKNIRYYYISAKKSSCLTKAKREINRKIRNGQLKRYSERYIDYVYHNYAKRKTIIGSATLLAVAVALAGIFTSYYLNKTEPAEVVTLEFNGNGSCYITNEESGEIPKELTIGETLKGIIHLENGVDGHLPSALDITMNGVPVPLSDYEFNPYTGEFSIVPTGDIKINVKEDTSDATFIYQYVAGGRNALDFYIVPSSSECKIYWGDTDTPQIITTEGAYTHTYEETTDGTRYTVKVSGVDSTSEYNFMLENYTGDQLVSAAYFDNVDSDINTDGYGAPSLLEELYIGKKTYIGQSLEATSLHTIIVDESNEKRSNSFDSNIVVQYNPDGSGVLKQGCNRSVIPDDKNIVDINPTAFMKSKIKEIKIPASVTNMLNNPFRGADYLTKIVVDPNSEYFTSRDQNGNEHNMITTKKSTSYFEQNEMMVACNTTTIPDDGTVKIIGESAYNMLSSIKNIDIPDCVEQIDGAAINDCPNLENINIQSSSNLTKFFYSDVGFILMRKKGQLNGCSSLKSVTIPAKVTDITHGLYDGYELFDATNTALTEMIVLPAVPPQLKDGSLFNNERIPPNLDSIYVPDEKVTTYQTDTRWNIYSSMIKPLSERPTH